MTQDTQITIREEIRQLAGDVSVPMTEVESRLGALYQQAESRQDEQSIVLIEQSWQHIQVMHAAYQTLEDLTVVAKTAAAEFQGQRDQALEELDTTRGELSELEEALDDPLFTANERVSDVVEFIADYAYENMGDELADEAYDNMYDGIIHSLKTHAGLQHHQAQRFVDTLINEFYMSRLSPPQIAALRSFVESFVEAMP